ncbi:snaclec coagulation factor X-activating enzyme light chain 1-like isoform X3 [Erythrolamprus reginae]|uniref:snaclec coagulation factor X-activating enzyme light chain 1-like isoform X3 n=1 Tax=Erythrolamprus reginae TaxID=121349 RepID=UPI00396C921D
MRMWSWLFICTFLGITSMHDVSAQTCLCAQGSCASGWVQYKSACYKAVKQPNTWTEAEISCQRSTPNSHLASIHSVEENDFIFHLMDKPVDYIREQSYWIGAHDAFKEGTFVWTDGSRFDYNLIPSEQPDGMLEEYYVASWQIHNGKISWNIFHESWEFFSVCKYYLVNRGCSSCERK